MARVPADPAELPFVTKHGQPKPPVTSPGAQSYESNRNNRPAPQPPPQSNQIWQNPNRQPPTPNPGTGGRDFTAENPSQRPGSPAARVNPLSVPVGGTSLPPLATKQPTGTGSPGARPPFKGMR